MLEGKGFTIHPHRQQGLASVVSSLGWKPDREVVNRSCHQLVGTRLDTSPIQQIAEGNSQPSGVAHQRSAHRVGDTRKGDVALDHREFHQLIEIDRKGVVDHSGERQRPAIEFDPGNDDRGVDSVEIGVGNHDWSETIETVERSRGGNVA